MAKAPDKPTTARTTEPVTNAANGSLRLVVVEPAIKDMAARKRAIARATSRIKTTARIDTITGE